MLSASHHSCIARSLPWTSTSIHALNHCNQRQLLLGRLGWYPPPHRVQEPAIDRRTRGWFLRTLFPQNSTAEPGGGSCTRRFLDMGGEGIWRPMPKSAIGQQSGKDTTPRINNGPNSKDNHNQEQTPKKTKHNQEKHRARQHNRLVYGGPCRPRPRHLHAVAPNR